jgi:hypothetical protein
MKTFDQSQDLPLSALLALTLIEQISSFPSDHDEIVPNRSTFPSLRINLGLLSALDPARDEPRRISLKLRSWRLGILT